MAKWFLAYIASSNQYVPKSGFVGFAGYISDVLDIGERLCVGEGNAWTTLVFADVHQLLGGDVVRIHLVGCDLRNLMVLTVPAGEVAPCACHRQAFCAGMELIERFFLHGINGQCARPSVGVAVKTATPVPAAFAPSCSSVGDLAMMGA